MVDISNLSREELLDLKKEIEEKLSFRYFCNKKLLIPNEKIEELTFHKYKEFNVRPYFAVRDAIVNLCDYAVLPRAAFKQRPNERSLEKPRSVPVIYSKNYKKMADELFEVFEKYVNLEETDGS